MKQLLIYLRAHAAPLWLLAESAQSQNPLLGSDLAEIPAYLPASTQITVFVPSTQLMILKTAIPSTNRRQIFKAIPFVLEPYLIDPNESIHIALLKQEKQRQWIAVVASDVLSAWLEQLKSHEIVPDSILPDVFCLPEPSTAWQALIVDDQVLCRSQAFAFSCEQDNFSLLCALWLKNIKASESQAMVIYQPPHSTLPVSLHLDPIDKLQPEYHFVDKSLLAYGLENVFAKNQPKFTFGGLLQGPYANRHGRKHLKSRLDYLTRGLILIWLASFGMLSFANYAHQKKVQHQLTADIQQICKRLFLKSLEPEVCESQFKKRYREWQFYTKNNAFFSLLQKVIPALSNSQAISIQQIGFEDNQLTVQLKLTAFRTLAELNQTLKTLSIRSEHSKTEEKSGFILTTFTFSDRET